MCGHRWSDKLQQLGIRTYGAATGRDNAAIPPSSGLVFGLGYFNPLYRRAYNTKVRRISRGVRRKASPRRAIGRRREFECVIRNVAPAM